MKLENDKNLILKNFLLGSLSESENIELGEKIILNGSFEDDLIIAEHGLIEDFLEKNLSPRDEQLFYQNFLINDEREEILRETFFFKRYAKRNNPIQSSNQTTETVTKSLGEKIQDLLSLKTGWAIPAFAVLLIILGAALIWGVFFYNSPIKQTPLENEFAQLNQQDLSNLPVTTDTRTVSLIDGAYRSSGSPNKLKYESLTPQIYFRLALPVGSIENETFNLEILENQNIIFRQNQLRVYKNQSGLEVRVILPKAILQKGLYQIKIDNPKIKDSSVFYPFAVE